MIEGYIYHLVENTLKKENAKEIIAERISWYEMELKHRQDKIDKAIEYIKENKRYHECNEYCFDNMLEDTTELENILQGSDKE